MKISALLIRLALALLVLAGPFSGRLVAQTTPSETTATAETGASDPAEWEGLAGSIEDLLAGPSPSAALLEQRRAQLVEWRARFLAQQSVNATRIETLRNQIDALGAAPAEGESEPEEIAARRVQLAQQLAVAQAPGIEAVESYSRADGLIREIDLVLRDRQAAKFLELWPSPLNPVHWPGALIAQRDALSEVVEEFRSRWSDEGARETLLANLPAIAGLLVLALVLIARGRLWIRQLALRLYASANSRGRAVWSFLASLGQVAVPMFGVYLVSQALLLSGMTGPLGEVLADRLGEIGFIIFAALWLGEQLFPTGELPPAVLPVKPERRLELRLYIFLLSLVLTAEIVRDVLYSEDRLEQATAGVIALPLVVLGGLLLLRIGQMIARYARQRSDAVEPVPYRFRIIRLIARATMILGIAAPALAAVGYVPAGMGIVYPTAFSLALLGLIFILQRLVGDLYALVVHDEKAAHDALVPVLIAFGLTLASIPLFALIWGARVADLSEFYTQLSEGVQIGSTRVSPGSFFLLILVFAFGFLVTRLIQGALRTSILPKTKIDLGGQKAVISGLGYIGILLSVLFAVNAAGLDLTGLAFVAGALSVGLGFGLQNIVSNFVSGIILLIERPVSEGDWIEVGGVQGTVSAISVRSTRIQTFDRTDVIVPNSDLISGVVTNWTRFNLAGRLIVKVGVAYGTDTRKVERLLREIAEAQPLAVMNPPPSIFLVAFGADSLDFEIRIILRDVNFSMAVRSEINHEIARRFAEEGIEIPFGQRDIWLRNPEALAELAKPAGPAPKTPLQPYARPEDASVPEGSETAAISDGQAEGGDRGPG